jgi:hypothetical protein
MSGCNPITPSQDGVPLESALASDPWLLKALRVGFGQVLRRPIETAAFIRHVDRTLKGPTKNRSNPMAQGLD